MHGSDVPLLYTHLDGTPIHWRNIPWFGDQKVTEVLPWDSLEPAERTRIESFQDACRKAGLVRPIVIGGTPVGLLYHGDYRLERQFRTIMAGGIVAIGLLAALTWFGLKIMQGTERSLLWVGLARETAHQLGTPISSLVGWIEYMKLKAPGNPPWVGSPGDGPGSRTAPPGGRPLFPDRKPAGTPPAGPQHRHPIRGRLLHTPASQGGSQGRARPGSRRGGRRARSTASSWAGSWRTWSRTPWTPSTGPTGGSPSLPDPAGRLGQDVRIDVEDNGRGIPQQHLRDVFLPGWSTKKRGWGLGLALGKTDRGAVPRRTHLGGLLQVGRGNGVFYSPPRPLRAGTNLIRRPSEPERRIQPAHPLGRRRDRVPPCAHLLPGRQRMEGRQGHQRTRRPGHGPARELRRGAAGRADGRHRRSHHPAAAQEIQSLPLRGDGHQVGGGTGDGGGHRPQHRRLPDETRQSRPRS
jgi:hypothetical protein